MRALLLLNLSSLPAKYWLIPSLMAFGALLLSTGAVALDRHIGAEWLEALPWLYAIEPEGARSVLSTIASSMITVAGVTFSITIVALTTAASTFGPRLISNLMKDRGSQITLGTFIATFVFCLLVLRTIRNEQDDVSMFVPHVAIIVALLFTLASLGVLIYFIHHVPETLHISNVLSRLGREFHAQVEELFPQEVGEPAGLGDEAAPPSLLPEPNHSASVPVRAPGYVQYIDSKGLIEYARKHDLVVELRIRPGDFVNPGSSLAIVGSAKGTDRRMLDDVGSAVVVGGDRSQEQDVLYLVNRLVEVAARALSPGTNDVFTALNAMDWLGAGLANLAHRGIPEPLRRDGEGTVRVIAPSRSFEEVAAAIFDQLRPYVAVDRNAAVHQMQVLTEVGKHTAKQDRRAVLLTHAKALRCASLKALDHPRDVGAIETAYAETVAVLSAPYAGSSIAPDPKLADPKLADPKLADPKLADPKGTA